MNEKTNMIVEFVECTIILYESTILFRKISSNIIFSLFLDQQLTNKKRHKAIRITYRNDSVSITTRKISKASKYHENNIIGVRKNVNRKTTFLCITEYLYLLSSTFKIILAKIFILEGEGDRVCNFCT
jgi:hypothetical protein